jgi:hypothetical protein
LRCQSSQGELGQPLGPAGVQLLQLLACLPGEGWLGLGFLRIADPL